MRDTLADDSFAVLLSLFLLLCLACLLLVLSSIGAEGGWVGTKFFVFVAAGSLGTARRKLGCRRLVHLQVR